MRIRSSSSSSRNGSPSLPPRSSSLPSFFPRLLQHLFPFFATLCSSRPSFSHRCCFWSLSLLTYALQKQKNRTSKRKKERRREDERERKQPDFSGRKRRTRRSRKSSSGRRESGAFSSLCCFSFCCKIDEDDGGLLSFFYPSPWRCLATVELHYTGGERRRSILHQTSTGKKDSLSLCVVLLVDFKKTKRRGSNKGCEEGRKERSREGRKAALLLHRKRERKKEEKGYDKGFFVAWRFLFIADVAKKTFVTSFFVQCNTWEERKRKIGVVHERRKEKKKKKKERRRRTFATFARKLCLSLIPSNFWLNFRCNHPCPETVL